MRVFKAMLKVTGKHIVELTVYFFVFMVMMVYMTSILGSVEDDQLSSFTPNKPNVYIVNDDKGDPVSDGLEEYLSENVQIVDIKLEKDAIADALFYQKIEYVLRIPTGFGDALLNDSREVLLEKTASPNMTSAINADMLVDRYLRTVRLYADVELKETSDQSVREALVNQTRINLEKSTPLSFSEREKKTESSDYRMRSGYGFLSYAIMSILILAVTSVTSVFIQSEVRSRMRCSPIKTGNLQLQLFLGNLCLAVLFWLLLNAVIALVFQDFNLDSLRLLLLLNSFVFSLVSLSLGFLIGNLTASRNAHNAIANVMGLGLSFISGVFVPQELLGATVLRIASFTPTYWYIGAIEESFRITSETGYAIGKLIACLAIQLCFALSFLALSLVVSMQRRRRTLASDNFELNEA